MHVFILVTEIQKTTMGNFQNNNKQLVLIVYFALFKIQLTLDSRVTLSVACTPNIQQLMQNMA